MNDGARTQNGITRRNLFKVAAGLAAGPKLPLQELPLQTAATPVAAIESAAVPLVETWVTKTTQLGDSLRQAWVPLCNWHNEIRVWDLNEQWTYPAPPVPQEKLEVYVRDKLEKMFTGILTPYRGFYHLKNAVFTGPPAEDARKETALHQIIAIKEPHYWAELQRIADAIPDVDPNKAHEAFDKESPSDSGINQREYDMLGLYYFRQHMTSPEGLEYSKKRTLGEHVRMFRLHIELLESTGLLDVAFKTEVKTRADNLQNQISAIAHGAGLDSDLANAITEADLSMGLPDNREDRNLANLRQDTAFFARLRRQISEQMSYAIGAGSASVLEAIQKEIPGAYLNVFKKTFPDVDEAMVPVPEVSERVFRDWAKEHGCSDQDILNNICGRNGIMNEPASEAPMGERDETDKLHVADALRAAANITTRAVTAEIGDVAAHLPEQNTSERPEPPVAIEFQSNIAEPIIPEKKEREPVIIGQKPA